MTLLTFASLIICYAGVLCQSASKPLLSNILLSHGILEPVFSAQVFSYDVTLISVPARIGLVPEIESLTKDAAAPIILYAVESSYTPATNGFAPFDASSEFVVPLDASVFTIQFKVMYATNPDAFTLYSVRINPSRASPTVGLLSLTVKESGGKDAIVVSNTAETLYNVYLSPQTSSMLLTPKCTMRNQILVNGSPVTAGKSVKIHKDKTAYEQLLYVTCRYKELYKNYVVLISTNYSPKDIQMPKLTIEGSNKTCDYNATQNEIVCMLDKRAHDSQIRLLTDQGSDIKYSIQSAKDDRARILLVNGQVSRQFKYNFAPHLKLVAEAGQFQKAWKIVFDGVKAPAYMPYMAYVVAASTLILLATLLGICGVSNLLGIGAPIGLTEVFSLSVFTLQALSFTQKFHASSFPNLLVPLVQWTTLFWEIPSYSMTITSFTKDIGIIDIMHARGCIIWCGIMFGITVIIHTFIIFKLYFKDSQTFPHRMRFGSWEQRILHICEFPVIVASVYLLNYDQHRLWQGVSACILCIYVTWALSYYQKIDQKILQKSITWVWHYPLNQMSPGVETETGYWSDVVCDQLLTQPVNRSIFGNLFPWFWSATVADIQPVNICCEMFSRGATQSTESCSMYDAYGDGAEPFGAVGRHVDVLQTVPPSSVCTGQHLLCGLLRCEWLDILFSYQALTKFYAAEHKNLSRRFVAIPLTVKTQQLSGNFVGGSAHYFFDGMSAPYGRIVDIAFRYFIGVFVGLTLGGAQLFYTPYALTACAILCIIHGIIFIDKSPHARFVENLLASLIFISLGTSLLGFVLTTADLALHAYVNVFASWLLNITLIFMSLFSYLVTFLTFCAVLCPSLEETKILEEFANCAVTISDHTESWAVELLGYSKQKMKDVKAQCSVGPDMKVIVSIFPSGEEPNIEFSVQDIAGACSTESLPVPSLVLFMPDPSTPLGYRWTNIYDTANAFQHLYKFLLLDDRSKPLAESIAKSLVYQLQTGDSYTKCLMCVTVLMSKKNKKLT